MRKKTAKIDSRDDEQRTFTVRITRGLHKALKSKAALEGKSLSALVAEKMREYVKGKRP